MHCFTLNVFDFPIIEDIDTTIIIGSSVDFNFPEGYEYIWSTNEYLSCINCNDPTSTPLDDITYEVMVVDEDGNGCELRVNIHINVLNSCFEEDLIFPNAFTPNGDGQNDQFCIVNTIGLENIESMEIYNRWGEKVFKGSGRNTCWDGTQRGKPVAPDVYIYIIKANCADGRRDEIVGEVVVLK